MLRVLFVDARLWRYVLSELAEFLENVGIKFDPKSGVRLKAMDPSHVALVDLYLPPPAFEEYNVEQETTLIIPLESVKKVLRRAMKTDKLLIESDGSRLTIGLISKGNVQRSFVLPLLSGSYEEIPELSLEFSVEAKTMGVIFATALSILEDVGDTLRIRALTDGISLASSSELSEVEIPLTTTSGTLIDYKPPEEGEEITNIYSMDYMSIATAISKLAETITIKLGRDMPCEIDLDLAAGSQLKLYVAPRTE